MRLRFHDTESKEAVKAYIDKCPAGQMFHVEIKRHSPKRTVPQNRLYWLYVACIVDETGNDRDTIHYELRRRFLPVQEKQFAGTVTLRLTSTTELDTAQFKNYIDRIIQFAQSDLGIALPDPADKYFKQFELHYKNFI